ncbi:hypothetical protein HBA54_06755 [Pelagibius litoralis]|uniref:Divergent polysaccharide deacetylase n=1 Tax=Pelagibius litoralis TaxID=374515 RepID=A0A967C8B4_9PROT|nr:divergent polysaccharide deacetylase family protein [Pelagibius litoralis]NIA68287.1 hypothetical protein [Pelagibius litoralis]
MRKLSPGSLLLIAAWLIVLGALGGGLGYGLLNPAPPVAEPVSVAMPAPEPLAETPPTTLALDDAAPIEATPGESEAAPQAPTAEPGQTDSEAPASEAAGPAPDAETPPAAAPETPIAEAPVEETPTEEAEKALKPPTETPAEAPAAVETPPETTETAPTQEGQHDGGKTVAIPKAKPEPPAAAVEEAAKAVAAEQAAKAEGEAEGEAGAQPADQQAVNVPVIPPAPEELPYWERYRQPFNTADTRPRIAVVLSGLGLSDSATQAAIDNLPPAITLSFSPYARGLERWIALARARGHEVMLDLPMEPTTFPSEDPGPQALLTNLSSEDNLDRLDWVLSRGSAYVGVAGSMGSRFTASRSQMAPILAELKSRGLIFLDNRTTEKSVAPAVAAEIGLHTAFNNRSVDERQASRVAIDARLAQIERIALSEGFAVAMAQPYPVTLDRLAGWSTELTARGFVIAPISALIDTQAQR